MLNLKPAKSPGQRTGIDFADIARRVLAHANTLLPRWLPHGERRGHEYVALNPRRGDKRLGSFAVNTRTGRWADFATGDGGGDLIALYAYLNAMPQRQAALELSREVGYDLP